MRSNLEIMLFGELGLIGISPGCNCKRDLHSAIIRHVHSLMEKLTTKFRNSSADSSKNRERFGALFGACVWSSDVLH